MKRKLLTILATLAIATLFTTQVFAAEITIQGRLQKTVEPGGWIIAAGNQKYLLLNSQRFLSEQWFAEGNEVESSGETKPDVMTTYMEGTPFEVRSLRPLAQGSSGASQSGLIGLTKVSVTGDSIVQAQPDTAILTVSVVTQGRNALEAAQHRPANAVPRRTCRCCRTGRHRSRRAERPCRPPHRRSTVQDSASTRRTRPGRG